MKLAQLITTGPETDIETMTVNNISVEAAMFLLGGTQKIKNTVSLIYFMMSKLLCVGENSPCTGSETFRKVYVEGEGVYSESSTYAHDHSLSDWKLKFILFSALSTFHSTS